MKELNVLNTKITYFNIDNNDYISLTDMLKSKDGDFFISDWLRNRNTIEFLGIWEELHNPNFNYGEFAIIKSQAGLNSTLKHTLKYFTTDCKKLQPVVFSFLYSILQLYYKFCLLHKFLLQLFYLQLLFVQVRYYVLFL